jgi:hypothetical protein
MTYRIPEPPLDPPERRLTADDIETVVEEARLLLDKIHGMEILVPSISQLSHAVHTASFHQADAAWQLEQALELAREYEEGE